MYILVFMPTVVHAHGRACLQGDMCLICEKRVYEMEKMLGDRGTYHKTCFRCLHCKRTLT